MNNDTIVSIATGLNNSGISIIRMSGDNAFNIINQIYRFPKNNKNILDRESHTINYGFIMEENKIIDEVMLSIFKAPKTYTRENIVEINCHGGIIVTKKILEIILNHGARLAEPGEFTKRAFLNGRIDLSQAEAVMDIIHSKNEIALKNSVNHLKGELKDVIRSMRNTIIKDIAFIEAALDDPEHISLDGFKETLLENIKSLERKIKKLILESSNGRIIKEGIKTIIVGKPNAGKSSLLNILAGSDRAIVTDIAGTTRDALEENISIDGMSLNIIDTAGIRETSDIIEKLGVDKAMKYIAEGDLIIYVVDSSEPLDENDYKIMDLIKEKKVIILLNKTDLKNHININEIKNKLNSEMIMFSVKEKLGLSKLYDIINKMFYQGVLNLDEEIYITNERHKESLKKALESLKLVKNSVEANMPEDFYSIDLTDVYENLGNILGERLEEDVINVIFSEFCMGK
ncbi:MAG TPA: tRNA uridine-5-carboxymethylaminomethyl(34) synthesis GTPase MnmE [Clostridiales bacterium]|nr:tRNA uridine-5-carboxymethylaminomethyl(34) synthesis GTPase MnmE [Clostridiales bacterium]